jgi:hypothetical protein
VITTIWLVMLYPAGLVIDGNPTATADEKVEGEVYGTALWVIGGGLLTGLYLLVRDTRMKKKTGRLSLSMDASEQTGTPSAGHRSRAWLGVVDVFAVLVLWVVGYQIARLVFSESTSELVGLLLPLAFAVLLVRHVGRSRAPKS